MSTSKSPSLLHQFKYNHEHLSAEEREGFLESLCESDKREYVEQGLIWLADGWPDLFTAAAVRVLEKAGRASVDEAGNVSLFGDLEPYESSFTRLYKAALEDKQGAGAPKRNANG
ncbi:MAG: hypothetical protein NXH85_13855 [Pseudomonadaceae bacterium]|nr:hypothetical protein [Pseudomonadaceae bacterium]